MSASALTIHARFIQFSLLLLFGVPSLICSLYIMYNVITVRSFRLRFQNQTLFVLIFVVLIDILLNLTVTLSFYARGSVLIRKDSFCDYWRFIDYTITAVTVWCMALFTIERYILVFYPNVFRYRRRRFLFHYAPLIITNLYLITFYSWSNFVHICDSKTMYDKHLCGVQCLDEGSPLSIFNWLFNVLFPVFIVIFGSLFLLIRVLRKRRELRRNLGTWSKNWKMITQLLGIAITYAIVWLPLTFVSLATTFLKDSPTFEDIEHYLYFTTYLSELALPIVALFLAPEVMQKIRRRIRPGTITNVSVTNGVYSKN